MSKVKLIVETVNGLSANKVEDIKLELPDKFRVTGIVRTDFTPESDGSVRASDDIEIVIGTDQINYIVGKLLTLVEATFTDQEQRKATKDLVMQTMWNWYEAMSQANSHAWRVDKGFEKN